MRTKEYPGSRGSNHVYHKYIISIASVIIKPKSISQAPRPVIPFLPWTINKPVVERNINENAKRSEILSLKLSKVRVAKLSSVFSSEAFQDKLEQEQITRNEAQSNNIDLFMISCKNCRDHKMHLIFKQIRLIFAEERQESYNPPV